MTAKIRNALTLYRQLRDADRAQIRLHRTVLYSSIYQADNDMLVNQHAYGIPAPRSPVLHLLRSGADGMFASYYASFECIWQGCQASSEPRT